MADRPGSTSPVRAWEVDGAAPRGVSDVVATEEPLEIRLVDGNGTFPVAVTMRTPGADFELAAGFLFSEGVIRSKKDVRRISYCVDREVAEEQRYNIVNVAIAPELGIDLTPLERHFSITSACGVCGKTTLDALRLRGIEQNTSELHVDQRVLGGLDRTLRAEQALFDSTGGLHAAGLFSPAGELVALREDVGRHNAMDKLVGWALLNDKTPLAKSIVLVSGRASYELVQKALVAGLPVLCSVSAPSSLAVELASEFGMTLIGFLRGNRFKVYAHPERVASPDGEGLLS